MIRTTVPTILAILALGVVLTAVPACQKKQPPPTTRDAGLGNRPWYIGTPEMQANIKKLLAQVPSTTGAGRLELGRRIVGYGEPAVPILVDSLEDPNQDLRGTAAWLLGFLKDPRSVPHLVKATGDPAPMVRYEAAASLLRMNDPRGLHLLIEGLSDRDARVRSQCIILLEQYTGKSYGYKVDDPPSERAAAVARWRAWARGAARSGL